MGNLALATEHVNYGKLKQCFRNLDHADKHLKGGWAGQAKWMATNKLDSDISCDLNITPTPLPIPQPVEITHYKLQKYQ